MKMRMDEWKRLFCSVAGLMVLVVFISISVSAETAFEKILPSAPGVSPGPVAAYDSGRNVMVLVTGEPPWDETYAHKPVTWEFDGSQWQPVAVGVGPDARSYAAMAYDAARSVCVMYGGWIYGAPTSYPQDTWTWNGSAWQQVYPAHSPGPQVGASMFYDAANQLVVLVGDGETWTWNGTDWSGPIGTPTAVGACYDTSRNVGVLYTGLFSPSTWEWDGSGWIQITPATTTPPFRQFDTIMFFDPGLNRSVICSGDSLATFDMWAWDGSDWVELTPVILPPAGRYYACAYMTSINSAVIIGGEEYRGGFYDALVDQTWLWDGSDWSELEPVTRPSPRSRLSLTWDSNRHRAVLFGGEIGQSTPDAETWEFDGSAWIQFSPGTHPPAQTGAAFAYDAFNQECVLFGNDETWTWDGSVWTQHTPGMHPLGDACMAFDPVNQETVLLTDATLETWTWDGAAWTQLFPSNPPFAALFIDSDMVYDAVRNECVTLIWDDMDVHTYTWDGTDWSHVVTGGPVFNGAMAFDPGSGHVLYFGGTGAAIGYEADALWVWNGSEWSSSRVYESGGPHAKSLAGMTPINDGVMMFGGIMQYTYRDAETWIFRNTPDVPALDFIGIAVLLIGIGGILIIRRTPML